ncbi:MAG: DMT family transporter [Parachlamydiales bacterium]
MQNRLGYGLFLSLLAYFFFAFNSSCVRLFSKTFPCLEILFFQSAIALFCLIIKNALRHQKISFQKPIFPYHLLRSLSGLVSYLFYYLAIKHTNLVDAAILNATAPFYVPFFWMVLTKEKIEKEAFWSIILGFLGILFILKPGITIFQISSCFGLLAGFFSAAALIGISFLNRRQESTAQILFYFFFISTLSLLPAVIYFWQTPSSLEILLLVSIGLLTFLAQQLLTAAFQYGSPAFLAPLSYTNIVYIALISLFFYSSAPSLTSLIGMFLVILGGSITFVLAKKENLRNFFLRMQTKKDQDQAKTELKLKTDLSKET